MAERTNTAKWIESRERWQINVQKDGKRKTFTSSTPGRTGQREANTRADEWLHCGVVSVKKKIKDIYPLFLAEQKKAASTAVALQLESYGRLYIMQHLGNVKVHDIRDNDVEKMFQAMHAKGLSKKTISNAKGILSKFIKWGRKNGYTNYRLDDVETPPNSYTKVKRVLQPHEIKTLLECENTMHNGKVIFEPLVYAFRFAVFTGVRPGELRGLKQEDIKGDIVHIKRSINVHGEETRGKNANALRSFVMSEQARQALHAQLKLDDKGEYIFPLPSVTRYRERFKAYCEYNGISFISPYEMRHTFVSVVKSLPVGELKTIVGHSKDMDTYGIYSHYLEGEDVKTAEKITALFNQIERLKNHN